MGYEEPSEILKISSVYFQKYQVANHHSKKSYTIHSYHCCKSNVIQQNYEKCHFAEWILLVCFQLTSISAIFLVLAIEVIFNLHINILLTLMCERITVSHSVTQQKADLKDGSLPKIKTNIKMLLWTL